MVKGNFKETKLKPVPIRLTQRQFDQLQELREFDGITMQDHVRRALDAYLDAVARKLRREEELEEATAVAGIPPNPRVFSRPKVTYR